MNAEIIAVGTEILIGQIVNSNATYLSEQLAQQGINVYYHTAVGDNVKRLTDVLTTAKQRSDLIVLCGGLGPTPDDLTKQTVAEFVHQELVYDTQGYQRLMDYFANSKRPMTENNLLQALVFKDGEGIQNPNGLAVGIYYEDKVSHTHYLLLPGPPRELKAMFAQGVIPLLQRFNDENEQFISRVLRFYGIGESRLVTELSDLIEQQTNPTIAPYAKTNEVTLRLTVKTKDEASGNHLLDELEARIMARVGSYFYGYGDDYSLVEATVDTLKQAQVTLAAAESLTTGLFQATLGAIPGASAVFKGGFVTYSPAMKASLLQLDADWLAEVGTVSQACVEMMAQKAKQITQADYAIAFSGVAGPDSLENQPVGTVWLALATPNGTISSCQVFPHGRNEIRQAAVMYGLNMVRQAVLADHSRAK
ncbi:competence/damage-inducible protein A [Enterococcus columbae]|uniref:Putative competence-damage inducible protein n=1 Tax=Enterococcus columbae DSM 7374 = ATCC 51263 TaxID=1121865 RepID=S0KDU0_9ENTE|nr:competence/damage-inducible protein A [Enterococcus columbae]EOT39100.1 competence/damage-inducible protein CinA [Enterococcus columbae DSM 7374 = ATCC 51263]EOW79967.1 competence/damage-inducible protein CinA [Enterococcus columbae DSM 7374 = ATCC 51263]OJG24005.1 competence/damage-inducible protein CinA [Enterococcus columbae DSM 7374 = ATCC 51263]